MPLSRSRDYLSIGELMEAVRDDFPDVSISKIRFLETEGLLHPQRTESGYRKFYPEDVNRLRQILSLQRDQFLPLRVIKQRLETGEEPAATSNGEKPADVAPPTVKELGSVELTRQELLKSTGLSEPALASLEEFGIIPKRDGAFDEIDLLAARTAKQLLEHGLEARHLRMFRQFADREVSVFSQIVGPALRRRDPSSSDEAHASLTSLHSLARSMHDAMLRSAMRSLL